MEHIIHPFLGDYEGEIPEWCPLGEEPESCRDCEYSERYPHYHNEIGLRCRYFANNE